MFTYRSEPHNYVSLKKIINNTITIEIMLKVCYSGKHAMKVIDRTNPVTQLLVKLFKSIKNITKKTKKKYKKIFLMHLVYS